MDEKTALTKPNTTVALSADVVASLVLNGDLSHLTQTQKVAYYTNLCQRVGLDPSTQPFKLLKLQGKEVMYADKGAAQQLSQKHNISHDVVKKERIEDVYVVTVKASLPDGRYTVDDGAVTVGNLKGDNLANALMKAMTKAKRRAVLALLGLGMLDESEVETIKDAVRVEVPIVEEIHHDGETPERHHHVEMPDEPKQILEKHLGDEPGDFIMPFGKFNKGKKLKDISKTALEGALKWAEQNKKYEEFQAAARSYLDVFANVFPAVKNDTVPF